MINKCLRALTCPDIDFEQAARAIVGGLLVISMVSTAHAETGLFVDDSPEANTSRLLLAQTTEASKTADKDEEADISDGGEDSLTRWHDILSDRIESMGETADRMFDPGIAFDEINQTSIRLRLIADAIEGKSVEYDPKLDVKWILPAAEGRFRLLLSSDDDQDLDGGNLGDPLQGDGNGSAALDFSIRDDEKWRLSLSLGATSDQYYTRFKLRRRLELGARWKSRIFDRLTYFSDDGSENDFRLDFERTLGRPLPDTGEFRELAVGGDRRSWLFRSTSRFISYENKESSLYEQRFSVFNRLSRYSAIAYEVLAFGCTDQNVVDETIDCREYDLRLRYKWIPPKYRWLAIELWPVAAFPESNDFDFTAQFRFQVEAWFGHGKRAQGEGSLNL